MQVVLYNNPEHFKKVDKRGSLNLIANTDCNLKDSTSILTPTLTFSKATVGDLSRVNYLYIPEFHRYYFVTDLNAGLGGVAEITGRVDVLTSNANDILKLVAMVSRNQYNYNMDLPDNDIPVMAKRNLTYRNFSATPFTTNPNGRSFVLVVSGSSAISTGTTSTAENTNEEVA